MAKQNPEQKLRKLKLLEEKKRLINGLPHLYGMKFYPWMREYFDSQNKVCLLCAANQIGKSSIQIRKMIHWATEPKLWPVLWPHRTPRQFWYLYPSSFIGSIEVEKKWIPEFLPRDEFKTHPIYGWHLDYRSKYVQALHFNSGISVYMKTYSQDPQDLQSGTCLWRHASILTNRGVLPISEVAVSDYVLGGTGWNRVVASSVRLADVLEVSFSNGTRLVGTSEHPVLSSGEWVGLGELQQSGACVSLCEKSAFVLNIAAYLFHKMWPVITNHRLALLFIAKNGKHTIIKKFLQVSLSITKTITLAITEFQIWASCLTQIIPGITERADGNLSASDGLLYAVAVVPNSNQGTPSNRIIAALIVREKQILNTLSALTAEKKLKEGWTQRRFFAQKSVQTLVIKKQEIQLSSINASTVVKNSKQDQVPLFAAPSFVTGGSIIKTEGFQKIRSALNAATNLILWSTIKSVAPIGAARSLEKKENVYNLQVDGDHTYFANGILVHNCDAIWTDEELPAPLWDELQARLFASAGYFSAVFTPTLGQEFWREAFMNKGYKERFPDAFKRQVKMRSCLLYEDGTPSFWTEERIQQIALGCKSDAEVRRRVEGEFVMDSGLVYPGFSPEKNLVEPKEIPPDWLVYCGVDSGSGGKFNHPAAISFTAVSPDFRQGLVFKGRRFDGITTTAADLVQYVMEMSQDVKNTIVGVYYDFAAADLKEIAMRMGANWIPAEKSHLIGQQILNVGMKTGMLNIFNTDELAPLVSELKSLKISTNKNNAADDAIDAMRYSCTKIPWDWSAINEIKPIAAPHKSEIEIRREYFMNPEKDEETIEREFEDYNSLIGNY